MARVLVIEDDGAARRGLEATLHAAGFDVASAVCAADGRHAALRRDTACIILDLLLPDANGIDFCRRLRNDGCTVPILILSGVAEELDKVLAFEAGADDYLTKPFGVRELVARIRALLRRGHDVRSAPPAYSFDGVTLEFLKEEASRDGKPLGLSVREFEVLKYFVLHEGEIVTRAMLLRHVWGYEALPSTRTVDNCILALRRKLGEDARSPRHLLTVPTAGYKFVRG